VDQVVPQQKCFWDCQRRAAAAILALLLVIIEAAGCGGGATGNTGGNGPPPPSFTAIDAPGAGTTTPQGTFGVGVTANDNVIGYFVDAGGVFHGFVRTSIGEFATIDAPGAEQAANYGTLVTAMNTPGEVTGYYVDSNGFYHSYLVSTGGTMTEFDPMNSTGSDAFCINDNGEIAGGVIDANGNHGFIRNADGSFTLLDPTGNPTGILAVLPYGINASGAVAGVYIDANSVHHGFTRDSSGNFSLLDAPGAGTASGEGTEPDGINAGGVIVGGIDVGVVNGVGTTHSFLRTADGTYTVFDPPQSGAHTSFAEGINDDGVIVGEYRDANLVRHGYLRQANGTFTSFDEPDAAQLPLSSTNLGTTPRSINADGAVAGLYTDTNGVRHAFIGVNLTNAP
jgi:uncharacterized membrane protein